VAVTAKTPAKAKSPLQKNPWRSMDDIIGVRMDVEDAIIQANFEGDRSKGRGWGSGFANFHVLERSSL